MLFSDSRRIVANPTGEYVDIVGKLDKIAKKLTLPTTQPPRSPLKGDLDWLVSASPLYGQEVTSNLLKQLDENPYIKTPRLSVGDSGGVPGVGALKNILLPLSILDTPRRAVISGVRELVDTLDSDPKTRASFQDFWNHTKDFDYGTGKAFPMKGWAGRIVGFVGDVALDPLTYATLGGTVAKNATHINKFGKVVSTRSILGKTVTSAEGRRKLAEFATKRMRADNKAGTANWAEDVIRTIYRDVSAKGKGALPSMLARDIGVAEPGIYFWGSRLRLPGSGIAGKFLERGLTRARLGIVNTRGIDLIHKFITPRGTGHFRHFGVDAIRDARVGLANGSLTPDEAFLASTVLEVDDLRRIRTSEVTAEVEALYGAERDFVVDAAHGDTIRRMLDNVPTNGIVAKGHSLGASAWQIDVAIRLRQHFDDIHNNIYYAMKEVDEDFQLGYVRDGYFPRCETEEYSVWRDKNGMASNRSPDDPTDAMRVTSNFKSRDIKVGDWWFKKHLEPEDMDIDSLNALAFDSLGFKAFHDNAAEILPRYFRDYAEQMGTAAMLKGVIERDGARFIDVISKTFDINDGYIRGLAAQWHADVDYMLTQIETMHRGMDGGLAHLKAALTAQHGSLKAAIQALKTGNGITQADVNDLARIMRGAIADAKAKYADYIRVYDSVHGRIDDKDGFGVFGLLSARQEKLGAILGDIEASLRRLDDPDSVGVPMDKLYRWRSMVIDDVFSAWEKYNTELKSVHSDISALLGSANTMTPLSSYGGAVFDGHSVYSMIRRRMDAIGPRGTRRAVTPYSRKMQTHLIEFGQGHLTKNMAPFLRKTADEVENILGSMLSSLSSGNIAASELESAYKWILVNIVRGDLESNGFSAVLAGMKGFSHPLGIMFDDVRNIMDHSISKSGVVMDDIGAKNAVHLLQDLLVFHKSLEEIRDISFFMRHYGITIGEEVADEIIRKNAKELLIRAHLDKDIDRVLALEDIDYGRRYGGILLPIREAYDIGGHISALAGERKNVSTILAVESSLRRPYKSDIGDVTERVIGLENDDSYVFHKSMQNTFNALSLLSALNLRLVDWNRIAPFTVQFPIASGGVKGFTISEKILKSLDGPISSVTEDMRTMVSQILDHVQKPEVLQQTARGARDISAEKALYMFVLDELKHGDSASDVRQYLARRFPLEKLWVGSDSHKFLGNLDEARATAGVHHISIRPTGPTGENIVRASAHKYAGITDFHQMFEVEERVDDPFRRFSTTGPEAGFKQLEADYAAAPTALNTSAGGVQKVKQAYDVYKNAGDLATQLVAKFHSVRGLVHKPDLVAIKKLEKQLLDVQIALHKIPKSVSLPSNIRAYGPGNNTKLINDYLAKKHALHYQLESGKKMLLDGLLILRKLGATKQQWGALEHVLASQVKQEHALWSSIVGLGAQEADNRLAQGAKNLLASGGSIDEFGVVSDVAGNTKFVIPVEWLNVVRSTKVGYTALGHHFPNLSASKEFHDLWQKIAILEHPEYLVQLTKYIGGYTKFHKAYATMTPGFHVRNGIANGVKLFFMGADWENMKLATPIYFEWLRSSKVGVSWKDFVKSVPAEFRGAVVTARKAMHGSGGGIFTETFKDVSHLNKLVDNPVVRFNGHLGQESDNYSRFVLAFDSAQKNMDVGLSQARVKAAFFDYEDLSELDEIMRLIVPFWLWTSRNLIFELQNQWLNPKPYQLYRSFLRNMRDPDYDPEEYPSPFIREMGGIKLPFGNDLYLAPDLGFTRTNQQIAELLSPVRYVNNMNPLIKIPFEEALGESTFSGQSYDTPEERLKHILKSGIPPLNQGDRLFGSEGDSLKNAWLSYFGSPLRTYNTKEK